MYALAFLTAWLLGRRRILAGRLPGVDVEGFGDLMFYEMLGVVLGGRVGYVLFYAFGDFLANPLMLVKVWDGGMSFHGGLLGVLAATWWWARAQGQHFFDVMDFIAPWVPPCLASPHLQLNWRPNSGAVPRASPGAWCRARAAAGAQASTRCRCSSVSMPPSRRHAPTPAAYHLPRAAGEFRAVWVLAHAATALLRVRNVRTLYGCSIPGRVIATPTPVGYPPSAVCPWAVLACP